MLSPLLLTPPCSPVSESSMEDSTLYCLSATAEARVCLGHSFALSVARLLGRHLHAVIVRGCRLVQYEFLASLFNASNRRLF